ncbi:MAG: prepilin-type N-terminal cleavage/methylation domain-containing protein [Planctomycetales bacterium]|nr:prepilin-type N-terminal cleavage/methylation domain-containing protein [Planctomycetales bacterium]
MSTAQHLHRRRYTLLELMIVLAILAGVMAIAWPRLSRRSDRARLQDSALQLKAELAEARQAAVSGGYPLRLFYVPGTSQYAVGTRPPDHFNSTINDSFAGSSPEDQGGLANGSMTFGRSGRNDTGGNGTRGNGTFRDQPLTQSTGDPGDRFSDRAGWVDPRTRPPALRYLSDDVVFVDPGRQLTNLDATNVRFDVSQRDDTGPATMEIGAGQPDSVALSHWQELVVFYPNGRANSANFQLEDPSSRSGYRIKVQVRGLTGATTMEVVQPPPPDEMKDPNAATENKSLVGNRAVNNMERNAVSASGNPSNNFNRASEPVR